MQLDYNVSSSDVDSAATYSDGSKCQQEWNENGNCYGKNDDIGYKSTPDIG
jgi:hypothetical protein